MEAREHWRENQNNTQINRTFWLDEMGVNCALTRLYGRAYSNERVNDYVPDTRFERTSVIGAMGLDGIIAPLTYKGTLNSQLFGIYVKKCLALEMKEGDTLILDNASPHKTDRTLKPLIDKGIKIMFLPPYSPDLNPIELAWSKIKSILRKVKARTAETLETAIGNALDAVTPSDCSHWIRHCGYGLQ